MKKEDIIRMAEQADGLESIGGYTFTLDGLRRFATLVAAAEREACAKLIELHGGDDRFGPPVTIERLAAAIRARGIA